MLMLAGYGLSEPRGRHLLLDGMMGAFVFSTQKKTFYTQTYTKTQICQ